MSANFARSTTDLLHASTDVKIALESEPKPIRWRHLLTPRTIFKEKPSWPNPEESIGVECSPLGRNKCWEAIGKAREISRNIYRETKIVLEQHADFLHESETIPFSITFGLYMVGSKERSANPTLIICCGPKKPRQKAMDLVRSSCVLQDYPGVLLAGAAQSPATSDQIRPVGDLGPANSNLVYFSPPRQYNVCGRPIYLLEEAQSGPEVSPFMGQKATIGGFIRLSNSQFDDLYCGLTVAHAFMDGLEPPPSISDMDFEFDEHYDEDDSEDESMPHKDEDTKHYTRWISTTPKAAEEPAKAKKYHEPWPSGMNLGIGTLFASSLDGENPDLDWALVEIESPHTEPGNVIYLDPVTRQQALFIERVVNSTPTDTSVLVVTGSGGIQKGWLSGTANHYKSPYGDSFEEVWTVRLDAGDKIAEGDSGSWVIDPNTGDLWGHIVAGSPQSRVGYMILAQRILDDITRHVGGRLELASSNPAARPTGAHVSFSTPEPPHRLAMGINQSKEELLRYLAMSEAVYSQMSEETDRVYTSMMFNRANVNRHVIKDPPYAWKDISEEAKREATMRLGSGENLETQPYWNMGWQTDPREADCQNWIARWFLYRQFQTGYQGTEERKKFVTRDDQLGICNKTWSTLTVGHKPEDFQQLTPRNNGRAEKPNIVPCGTAIIDQSQRILRRFFS